MPNIANSPITNRTILYYPTISIPDSSWLRQTILYWDQVASIVPTRYDSDKNTHVPAIAYSPEIEYLNNEGIFRAIHPETFFKQPDRFSEYDKFCYEIEMIINSESFKRFLGPENKWSFDAHIHNNKVSHDIFTKLMAAHLVKKIDNNWQWLLFETRTGLLYMSLLAKHLADIDTGFTIPGTDQQMYESLIYEPYSNSEGHACLAVSYQDILPTPKNDISLPDIIEFKNNNANRQALLRFRSIIDELHRDLAYAEKQKDVREIAISHKDKIELGVIELYDLLHESRIETVSGCFKTLVDAKSPTIWGSLLVAAGKATSLAAIPLNCIMTGTAIAGGIQIAHYLIERHNKKRAALRESDFAYVYQAEKWGII